MHFSNRRLFRSWELLSVYYLVDFLDSDNEQMSYYLLLSESVPVVLLILDENTTDVDQSDVFMS